MSDTPKSSFVLTPHQRHAMRRDRHLSVTANAGSGKTRVLVERYLDILLSGSASVHEIVALTFTEKAASELRRRIAESVSASLASSTSAPLTRRMEAIRDELASAAIGTIHGFCSRLLREHPVEADVDAAFGIIEGLDRRTLLEASVRDTFQNILAPSPAHPLRENVVEAIRTLGRPFVERFVMTMADRRAELERLTQAGGPYSRADDEVLALWKERIEEYVNAILRSPSIEPDLRRIIESATGKRAGAVADQFRAFCSAQSLTSRSRAFSAMMNEMLTEGKELRLTFLGKASLRDALTRETHVLVSCDEALAPLLPLILSDDGARQQLQLLLLTRTLLTVVREAVQTYDRNKTEAGQLDYEDLLLKVRDLLSHENIRSQLQARYAYVMVDEYQDTNQLQYDILLPLLNGLARGNLFIVGDPKQSIYSFRQANVEVFQRTRDDIRQASGRESDVILEESFRPLRDVAAFTNLLFSRIMNGKEGEGIVSPLEDMIRYEPLVRARQSEAPGRVEILYRHGMGDPEPVTESEMISRRIGQIVSSRLEIHDSREQPHPARFGDIAILLRARTALPELEESLVQAGIPYTVSSGVGYFQTQDIIDVYDYLAFLLNPADDVALAGILRSPMYTVSDAELFEVAGERAHGDLWQHLVRLARKPETPGAVRRAVSMLEEDLAVALRLPVPELIGRIFERTHYYAKIAGTTRGEQARANLEKLLRIARVHDQQGFATLFDFVTRLRGLIEEEEKEGQGSIDAMGDTVRVMTVHAAKGLEFPIVILPFLHRRQRRDQNIVVDDRIGIGFPTPGESGETFMAPLSAYLQRSVRLKREAEELRIFYVGCTRARDMLVLSVDATRPPPAASAAGQLLGGIAPGGVGSADRLEFPVRTKVLKMTGGEFAPGEISHTLTVHVVRPENLPAAKVSEIRGATEAGKRRISVDPVAPRAGSEIFSATKIRTYVECPSRYFLRYVLGFPAAGGPFAAGDDDEMRDRDLPADLRGRIVHAVAQRVAPRRPGPEEIAREARAALERESTLAFAGKEVALVETTAAIEKLVASDIWTEMARGTESRTEFTVSIAFGNNYLTGTFDRIYRDPEGVLTVIDYKTDAVDASSLEERGRIYWPQLEFYALVASKYFRVPSVKAVLVFIARIEQPLARTLGPSDLARIEKEVSGTIGRIESGDFRPPVSPCRGCPFSPRGCEPIWKFPPQTRG